MMMGALGRAWRLREWYGVDLQDEGCDWPKQYEFVYVPEPRPDAQRLAELSSQATTALDLALPAINHLLQQAQKLP
jgi:DNA-directed RNA polymerase delta subunit